MSELTYADFKEGDSVEGNDGTYGVVVAVLPPQDADEFGIIIVNFDDAGYLSQYPARLTKMAPKAPKPPTLWGYVYADMTSVMFDTEAEARDSHNNEYAELSGPLIRWTGSYVEGDAL